jgi:hypothetical protein
MKNLIKTLFIIVAITVLTIFSFSIKGNTNIVNHDCPGFDVTVVGSNGGFTITVYKNGNPIGASCYTGQGGYHCCVTMSKFEAGYYDVCANNGLCQGCTYNVYWPGLGDNNIPVTVDVREGCYK